jgi:hypothetical protein
MSNAVPGYYDDGSGAKRWWDGTRWGEPAAAGFGAPGYYAPVPPRRPVWPWIVGGAALLLLMIVGLVVAVTVFASGLTGATTGAGSPASVVSSYDRAWETVDCDLYEQITTSAAREQNGHSDCADFESDAQDFIDGTDNYLVTVTSSRVDGSTAEVRTDERYDDEDGGSGFVDHYLYTLIRSGSRWIIDGVQYLDGPDSDDSGNGSGTNAAGFEVSR